MTIRSIDTKYDEHLFRSRLEARWAVFFNALHIKWLYEPQGFDIDGRAYLPDFCLLLGKMLWAEVKPAIGADPDGESRFRSFISAQPVSTRGVLLTDIRDSEFTVFEKVDREELPPDGLAVYDLSADGGEGCGIQMEWVTCAEGYHFDVQHLGSLVGCFQCGQSPSEAMAAPWDTDKRIDEAYRKARSARFEVSGG